MVDNDPEPAGGPDMAGPSPETDQNPASDVREKAAHRKIEDAKFERNKVITTWKVVVRNAAIGLAVVVAGFTVFQLFSPSKNLAAPIDSVTPDFAQNSSGAMTAVQCDNPDDFAETPDHPCHLKIQFQDSYRDLSTQYIPALQASVAEGFVQEKLAEILALEQSAIQAFDRSEYARAVTNVEEALRNAKTLKQEIADTFQASLSQANDAFLNDNAVLAQDLIDRALRLNGNSVDARALHARIGVLPEVLALFKTAAETEAQNQLLGLQGVLKKIVQLDPQRLSVALRLATLEEKIKRAKYNRHLQQASADIKAQNTQAARLEVAEASALYPGEPDTAALSAQIDTMERNRRVSALLQDAEVLEKQDNWPAVMARFEQILGEDASNRAAINGREKANKIISANNRVVDILNRQIRLQDATVYQKTLEFIDLIKPLAPDSKTLASSISTLEERLELWQQKVQVTVRSDGKSQVSVRRVGQVGTVKQKDILLRPGNYDFECSRKGYQSKIVEHFVPPGQNGTLVSISCDVRI